VANLNTAVIYFAILTQENVAIVVNYNSIFIIFFPGRFEAFLVQAPVVRNILSKIYVN
jgi:hypothetical protein